MRRHVGAVPGWQADGNSGQVQTVTRTGNNNNAGIGTRGTGQLHGTIARDDRTEEQSHGRTIARKNNRTGQSHGTIARDNRTGQSHGRTIARKNNRKGRSSRRTHQHTVVGTHWSIAKGDLRCHLPLLLRSRSSALSFCSRANSSAFSLSACCCALFSTAVNSFGARWLLLLLFFFDDDDDDDARPPPPAAPLLPVPAAAAAAPGRGVLTGDSARDSIGDDDGVPAGERSGLRRLCGSVGSCRHKNRGSTSGLS